MRIGAWLDPADSKLVVAIGLTGLGLIAAIVFNVAYFGYVLPFMRRRRGGAAIAKALFNLFALEQIIEYCRLARIEGLDKNRNVALVIKASAFVFVAAFVSLGVLCLL
jgi:hypothetical protein